MDKHKHLDLIAATISRMAQNSFAVRGWCITVVTAIIAFGVNANNPAMILLSLMPLVVFWTIDANYLRQERAFRDLYDKVRVLTDADIDFDMAPEQQEKLVNVMFGSLIFALLYLGLAIAALALAFILWLSATATPN